MLRTFSVQTPVFTLLYRGYDIEVSRARRLAGGSVSIHEPPTFPSFDEAKFVPAIKMPRSSRPSAVWTVFFTRTNRILVASLAIHRCRAVGGRDRRLNCR